MWLARSEYQRLVSESSLALQVPKLELRAEAAELALATERKERIADVRHVLSMWLRHERALPLQPTAAEKAETEAERQRKTQEPPELNADQLARRAAVRDWAMRNGFTEAQADESFMSQLSQQIDE